MSDIEFDDPPEAAPTAGPAAGPIAAPPVEPPAAPSQTPDRQPDLVRGVGVAVLWAGGALLSLLAAYARLYAIGYGPDGAQARYSVDSWGHYAGAGAGSFPQSGARYALLFCACALLFGLLTVAAVGRALRLPVGPRLEIAITGGSFAAAALLAGTLASVYLQTDSILQNVRDRVRFGVAIGDPVRGDLSTSIGAGPYLALAALACAVLAIAATLWRRVGEQA